MLTKQDLCSMALLKLGEQPLTSLAADTAAAKLARTLCDITLDSLLSWYPWRFAMDTLFIERNSDGDLIIPENVLRIIKCPGHICGNKIITNMNTAKILAITRVAPEQFPSYFTSVAATKLAMEFCIPLTGNQQMFRTLVSLYESELQSAKFIDSTMDNNNKMNDFSLINVRF